MIDSGSKIFYVHGLYGSKSSRKFKEIVNKYPEAVCLEWKYNDNIAEFIQHSTEIVFKENQKVTLIGSSAGGNLAWQIQQELKNLGKEVDLILINPLVETTHLYENNMPVVFSKYIKSFDQIFNTKVIIGLQDEIINPHQNKGFFELYDYNHPNQLEIIAIDDDHRISNFNQIIA